MESITDKLIPGIIALLSGVVFIIGRKGIEQRIISSHEKFWKQTLKLNADISGFTGLFLKFFVLFLGTAFLLIGLFLMYQFFRTLKS